MTSEDLRGSLKVPTDRSALLVLEPGRRLQQLDRYRMEMAPGPANRESPLLRRVGLFTAAAFFCTGFWSIFVPIRWFGLAQLMLLAPP